ncbi:MAG: GNAT family N-acetyltransferase [Desulfobacterales bacterium]|jgi:CelD/BcsL family acetyltransferase involved in cellulose biosynthesis
MISIWSKDRPIGIAPLWTQGETARLLGRGNVCDYLDFVVSADAAPLFYNRLLDHLRREGIKRLELKQLRPDSSVMAHLLPVAEEMGCEVSCKSNDISFELELPNSWDQYLSVLTGKERHEIRRKFRRLQEVGDVNYRAVAQVSAIRREMDTFLTLFRASRRDKSAFMNDQMYSFFQDIAVAFATDRIIKLFFLDIGGKPTAAVMCFDYETTRYLYNSGYDKQYGRLSVGLLSKVLSIRESIRSGKRTYDLLKGSEPYKHRLGGKPVPLYHCTIGL